MTALACNRSVSAVERKAGLLVVIEQPLLPVDRVVAECASFTESPLVRVVFAVATDAVFGGIAEHVRFVTIAAVRVRMPAQ